MSKTPDTKTLFHILIIICVALGARFLYGQIQRTPGVLMYPDSYGYYGLGTQMVASPRLSTVITPYRTPLYPLFVGGTAFLLGKAGADVRSPDFQRVGSTIILLQELIAIVTLILLYKGLSYLDLNKRRALFITLFFSVDPMLLAFERTMLTETMTVFFSALVTYASVRILMKPTHMNFLLFLAASTLGFLTRPAFLAIPVAAAPFLLWFFFRKKNRLAMGFVMLTTLCYLLVPVLYSWINERYYGYKGIQEVSDIDMLGRILEFRISPDAGKDIRFLYTEVQKQQRFGGPTMPFEFINSFDPTLYGNMEKMNGLQTFVRRVVKTNFALYCLHAFSYSPRMLFDVSTATFIPDQAPSKEKTLFQILWHVYRISQYPSVLVFFVFPFLLSLFFKHTTIQRTVAVLCISIVVTQVLLTVFVVYYEDYGRLALIFRPQLYILFLYGAQNVCKKGLALLKKNVNARGYLETKTKRVILASSELVEGRVQNQILDKTIETDQSLLFWSSVSLCIPDPQIRVIRVSGKMSPNIRNGFRIQKPHVILRQDEKADGCMG
ncbi:MAG: hypothetical protein UW22_C0059G0011 [Candidatus Gottesmanbacteria bacterium GW2011_GWB1_44_11c]|uniref:Glycosyltransferase RgtA/B/C/D-like domain-containing protein n=2 Tax=Candidatus Gottesmaniibacteriota TaxID=1752720 RepID=A0A0G1IIC9_9BACT|nr:MAG: hypothetical protein UW22_C0059G0011 [Candidatus Gottesmanbacteria bacterium GW2011_GWB1_44_11c]KKT59096.1 MAG: hypothetical protein UW52_C0049G0014 [Candidatus Gottesmanbacteria bacterium GW2011_GWA1_44_24b]